MVALVDLQNKSPGILLLYFHLDSERVQGGGFHECCTSQAVPNK